MQILWKSMPSFWKKKLENHIIHLLDLSKGAVVIWIKGNPTYFLKALEEVHQIPKDTKLSWH